MRTLLMIDDETDFNFFIKETLELTGKYTVLTAVNGPEGIALAIQRRPDLILLDFLMPGFDGARIYRELDANPLTRSIPVLMLTALDPAIASESIPELPRDAFLTKPIEVAKLKAKIEAVLGAAP